jgi:3,4-dihydroxy 2-butanone 4-phosphate synthase/GTP cyclohydrolase II
LEAFSEKHDIPILSIEEIARLPVKRPEAMSVTELESANLPTRFGNFTVTAFRDTAGLEHLALQMGQLSHDALVRLHSECLTGDVLGSLRCDCGDQLQTAMKTIADEGSGLIVYLRQEGRGIGLANKIRAYALQDNGLDTVEANVCLGFSPDMREYATAADIIKHLGVSRVRLMTNNPGKVSGLESNDISVTERISLPVVKRPENARYLETKIRKLEHLIEIAGS